MNSVKIEIAIPEDVMFALNKNTRELSEDVKKLLAIELYNTNKLSLGKSSELANLCREDFIKLLSQKGHSLFNWDSNEIKSELDALKKLSKEI